MSRPTLISDRPPASEPPSSEPVSRIEAAPSDFGRWLTRDLRPKGTPSEIPISERPSEPRSLVIQDPHAPELSNWLGRELKPRSSAPPAAPFPAALLPAALLPAVLLPAAARADSLAPPPDSLMPHAVSEAPPAAALDATRPDGALHDEDLAVLPTRVGKAAQDRWRHAVVLAALLALLGAIFWGGSGSKQPGEGAGTLASAPAVAAAPLPPPPPSLDELSEEAESPEEAPAQSARSGGSSASAGDDLDEGEGDGARARRAGDAVARFADLPGSTLSRLAREERQKARGRAQKPAPKPPSSALP